MKHTVLVVCELRIMAYHLYYSFQSVDQQMHPTYLRFDVVKRLWS